MDYRHFYAVKVKDRISPNASGVRKWGITLRVGDSVEDLVYSNVSKLLNDEYRSRKAT